MFCLNFRFIGNRKTKEQKLEYSISEISFWCVDVQMLLLGTKLGMEGVSFRFRNVSFSSI